MSEQNEHELNDREKSVSGSDNTSSRRAEVFERPKGFRGLYSHPTTQIVMLGFVCFMCPGLFNALNGLGAGGQVDSTVSANANSALYATFAVAAFFAGSINNMLGSRVTLLIGSMGYSLYIGSFLATNIHPHAYPFVLAAGAVLGICAGLLWTAQGSLMMSYPTESEKGMSIGIFWSIFNLGGVVGAAVSFAENFHSKENSVGNGTYIAFMSLTVVGVALPLLMLNPRDMIRTDGTKVTAPRHPSWKTEFYGLWVALRTDPLIVLLFPMFFASNWFYTWQFNEYNGALFNIRTRSLNNFVYWMAQIVGSLSIGFLLDQTALTRRFRAFSGWCILMAMIFVVHIWGYMYQRNYTRASMPPDDGDKMDFSTPGYAGRVWLYIFCGLLDSMWQTTAYWLMGAMSNDPAKLAHFAGFYKSMQSAGAAGIWRGDAVKLPYMNVFLSTWILLVAGLVFALPMIHLRVKEHTMIEDETLARMDEDGHIRPSGYEESRESPP
ncbi:MFS general substrate transporter [Athelia psychrophila]|uniref:MFS general substrate transporter n=1 Tax=Athelia psychrophila TaxID=1759441 RepID=A0A165X6Y1_9AGAM|nr:MFS general substrate transporter [Fibularhizoctonia sp. CBS 109695]